MHNFQVIFPDKNLKEELKTIAVDFKENKTPFDIYHIEKIINSYDQNNLDDYFQTSINAKDASKLPPDRVPSYFIWVVDGDKIVAIADIRPILNDYLRNVEGGHLAYAMVPAYRGKGLMNKVGKLILQYAKENFDLNEVLITCHVENIPSYRVITRLINEMGGHPDTDTLVDGHIEKRCWVKTFHSN